MRLLINARNRSLGVEGQRIVEPTGAFDLVLDLPQAEVRPGLINAHDHLHRNHYGRLGRPPYRNAYRWAADIQTRCRAEIVAGQRLARREALLVGAWKNLFAGVTTVVHHDAWEADFDDGFPLRVARIPSADSLGMSPDLDHLANQPVFALHLAEGVDAAAAEEVRVLAARGLLTPGLIAVHGLGLDAAGQAQFREAGAALAWCPSSNLFLFGRTIPRALAEMEVDILLGSDSRLTGTGDLLDELRLARALGLVGDARLLGAVGAVAARRLGLTAPSLEPGAPADLVVMEAPLLAARAQDVLLVLAEGAPRVIAPDLVPAFGDRLPPGAAMTVASVTRWTSVRPVLFPHERPLP